MIGRLVLILIAAMVLPVLALAADPGNPRERPQHRAYSAHAGPYPLSWRAAKIRRADRCWRACLADMGRDFQACLRGHHLTDCVHWNAAADRYCLRECRLAGGPWVDVK